MTKTQGRPKEAKPNQPKEQKVKSLEFLKPTLATTLAIVLAWLLSVRPAQAGYTVTLQQVGGDVVATGSGGIDLHGLTFSGGSGLGAYYIGHTIGPTSFGGFPLSSSVITVSSGNFARIATSSIHEFVLRVPPGYVSGTFLSGRATYSGQTLAHLAVTPGTYVWRWGTGANQNFTLKTLPAIPPATNITNISARASVQTDQGVTIAGFIVSGTDPKQVVIRGLGPTLTNFNVTGVLADPTLGLYDGSGTPIFSNNDWKNTQQAEIQATGLAPSFDVESAILITLQPGNYTAILSGNNGTTGVGLVEVYDIATGAVAELINVSTRGFVGTDEAVMIGGFITSGGSTQVVVRGLGPTLTQFGVSGALADPVLTLVDGNGNVVQTNNNWQDTQQAAIEATGFAPPNDLEAAILVTVPAGNHTAILSGNGGGTGIGLVEVYKL